MQARSDGINPIEDADGDNLEPDLDLNLDDSYFNEHSDQIGLQTDDKTKDFHEEVMSISSELGPVFEDELEEVHPLPTRDYNQNADYARMLRESSVKRQQFDMLGSGAQQDWVGVNLKGLKQLMAVAGRKEQFDHMVKFIRNNRCEVVVAQEQEEVIDLKQMEQEGKVEKVEQAPNAQKGQNVSEGIKIREQVRDEVKIEEGMQRMQPVFLYFRSQQMLNNFNSFGQSLYYQEVLGEDCEDIRLATLAKQCKVRMGLVYGFTLEARPATFGVYAIMGDSPHFLQSQTSFLMSCLLQVTMGKAVRHFPNITFFAHKFKDIADLSALTGPYRQEMLRMKPRAKIPTFQFLLDPAFMNYSHLFGEEKIPFKEELEDCLKKLLTSSSRKTFGLTQTRLFQLLSNDGVGAYRMASGYTVLEFVEILMQQGEYICLSQMQSCLGVVEYYFRKHPTLREPRLSSTRQQVVNHCMEIYLQLAKDAGQQEINGNVLVYVGLGVIDRLVQTELQEHRKAVNLNFKQLGIHNYKLMEDQIPELRFIKVQTSTLVFDYLLKELAECYAWEVSNQSIIDGITYFNLEIEQQDQLYYQQYQRLPIRMHRSGGRDHKDYFDVKSGKDKWQCECGQSLRYGLPCCHELKICLLTNQLIMSHMGESLLDEEYYDKCVEEEEKLEAKIENIRKKEDYLQPMGTQPGRNALINKSVNSRKYSKGSI